MARSLEKTHEQQNQLFHLEWPPNFLIFFLPFSPKTTGALPHSLTRTNFIMYNVQGISLRSGISQHGFHALRWPPFRAIGSFANRALGPKVETEGDSDGPAMINVGIESHIADGPWSRYIEGLGL